MQSELPKVLHSLIGKPLISHVIDNIRQSEISDITVVVGYKGDDVQRVVGETVSVVWQHEQLGTGHAVLQAKDHISGYNGKILVACGDAPLISSESFRALYSEIGNDVRAAVLTMVLDNPSGYGRMIKNLDGTLLEIVEQKDANDEEKLVTEVNSGTYVFDAELLLEGLMNIGNDNAQNEYYLTDVVSYIVNKGFKVKTVPLSDPLQGRGINSKDELSLLEEELLKGKR